jgi:hypothetical protein
VLFIRASLRSTPEVPSSLEKSATTKVDVLH